MIPALSEFKKTDPTSPPGVPSPPAGPSIPEGWQTLTPAAVRVGGILGALVAAPITIPVTSIVGALLEPSATTALALGVALLVLFAVFGVLYGRARAKRVRWRLDRRGLQVSRGLVWQGEVLVPRSRVQHLDIERGPIERRFGLASLVVHTAGTRLSALRQGGFVDAEAVALRDALLPEAGDDDDL